MSLLLKALRKLDSVARDAPASKPACDTGLAAAIAPESVPACTLARSPEETARGSVEADDGIQCDALQADSVLLPQSLPLSEPSAEVAPDEQLPSFAASAPCPPAETGLLDVPDFPLPDGPRIGFGRSEATGKWRVVFDPPEIEHRPEADATAQLDALPPLLDTLDQLDFPANNHKEDSASLVDNTAENDPGDLQSEIGGEYGAEMPTARNDAVTQPLEPAVSAEERAALAIDLPMPEVIDETTVEPLVRLARFDELLDGPAVPASKWSANFSDEDLATIPLDWKSDFNSVLSYPIHPDEEEEKGNPVESEVPPRFDEVLARHITADVESQLSESPVANFAASIDAAEFDVVLPESPSAAMHREVSPSSENEKSATLPFDIELAEFAARLSGLQSEALCHNVESQLADLRPAAVLLTGVGDERRTILPKIADRLAKWFSDRGWGSTAVLSGHETSHGVPVPPLDARLAELLEEHALVFVTSDVLVAPISTAEPPMFSAAYLVVDFQTSSARSVECAVRQSRRMNLPLTGCIVVNGPTAA